jgi:hypothetical protein
MHRQGIVDSAKRYIAELRAGPKGGTNFSNLEYIKLQILTALIPPMFSEDLIADRLDVTRREIHKAKQSREEFDQLCKKAADSEDFGDVLLDDAYEVYVNAGRPPSYQAVEPVIVITTNPLRQYYLQKNRALSCNSPPYVELVRNHNHQTNLHDTHQTNLHVEGPKRTRNQIMYTVSAAIIYSFNNCNNN